MQVQQFVSRCVVCDQVQASFNAPTLHLQPLPIMGLGYRWSLDFVDPLNLTSRHNQYVLVMIEHFSKWLELVPLMDHSSEGVTFVDMVSSRFRVPIKIFIDQSTPQKLCEKTSIDHCTTSRDHPDIDELAKRIVQMVKWGLQKYGFHKGQIQD